MAYSAFTTKYKEGLSNKLISQDTRLRYMGAISRPFLALWDTGATRTCISEEVAKELKLVPTGKEIINTPSGSSIQNSYLVDLLLPNGVVVQSVMVIDTKIGSQQIDLLIGMDIITLGDFAVSNFNNKTYFSFRTPSQEHIDYCQQGRLNMILGTPHGKGSKKKRK